MHHDQSLSLNYPPFTLGALTHMQSPFRLDSVVLELMHRHREDANPTGASFPSSPLRRPGSARSFSSQGLHRPWTPSKNFAGNSTLMSSSTNMSTSAQPSFQNTNAPGASSEEGETALPLNLTSVLSPAFSSSSYLGVVPTLFRTASPGAAQDPGIIGSGSPRSSPRFWNKAPTPLSVSSSYWDSIDSIAAQPGSPWGGFNLTGGLTTPSGLSNGFGFHTPSFPFSPVPPGRSPTTPASTSSAAARGSSSAAGSRPPSPSPFNSPRLSVTAAAFKPRTASSGSQISGLSAIRPSFLEGSSRRSSSQAVLHKTHPTGEDDDEDEFSPFGTSKADSTATILSVASSLYGSSAGSSVGDAAEDANAYVGESTTVNSSGAEDEEGAGLGGGMTPFDVLYSILAGAKGAKASQWNSEQIEEALASHNWDVDATLGFIFENMGKLTQSTNRLGRATATSGSPAFSPRFPQGGAQVPPTGPAAWTSGRAGVAVMPREAFQSFRGGRAGGWSPASSFDRGSGSGVHCKVAPMSTGLASPVPGATAVSESHGAATLPSGSLALGAGGAGPGRVCRYFLSGDCRRADCRFSHDLSKALCKFWLRGQCLNDPCPFLHDQDVVQALASGMASITLQAEPTNVSSSPTVQASTVSVDASTVQHSSATPSDDFPELPPSGPKADRSKHLSNTGPPIGAPTGPAASDPSRSRWANALQQNPAAGSPMKMMQNAGAEVGLVKVHARSALISAMRPPLGPRTASSASGKHAGPGASSLTARIMLRAPTLLPTLSVGKSAAQSYEAHRSGIVPLIEQRNRCLAKASEAFRAGDGSAARKWSTEGQALNAKIAEKSPGVARDIVKARHRELQERLQAPSGTDGGGWGSSSNASDEPGARGLRASVVGNGLGLCLGVARKDALPPQCTHLALEERTECFLDAHGLHAGEAIDVIEEFLLALEQHEGAKTMRGLVYLAVGSSRHSSMSTDRRRVKLAGAVKGFLGSWGYPFAEHDGVLVVDHLTHF